MAEVLFTGEARLLCPLPCSTPGCEGEGRLAQITLVREEGDSVAVATVVVWCDHCLRQYIHELCGQREEEQDG